MLCRNTMAKATLTKENISLGLAYSSEVHHRGREHNGIQADMVLEKKLRVPHLDSHQQEVNVTLDLMSIWDFKAHPLVMHFLQQSHT